MLRPEILPRALRRPLFLEVARATARPASAHLPCPCPCPCTCPCPGGTPLLHHFLPARCLHGQVSRAPSPACAGKYRWHPRRYERAVQRGGRSGKSGGVSYPLYFEPLPGILPRGFVGLFPSVHRSVLGARQRIRYRRRGFGRAVGAVSDEGSVPWRTGHGDSSSGGTGSSVRSRCPIVIRGPCWLPRPVSSSPSPSAWSRSTTTSPPAPYGTPRPCPRPRPRPRPRSGRAPWR